MTHCSKQLSFPFFQKANLVANFQGGTIITDGGLLLVRQLDERIRFTQRLSDLIYDPRHPLFIAHPQVDLIRQRLYQIIAGYEDCNDAAVLREDPIFKALAGRTPEEHALGSQPTLSRLENRIASDTLLRLVDELVRVFIETRPKPLSEITLDMDPSVAKTYGAQQLTFFNAYYDSYMYFPNFLCDARTGYLLAPILRPGNVGAAHEALLVLSRVVQLLRAAWPKIQIRFRGDSGFAVPELLNWLEEEAIPYTIGMASNDVLKDLSAQFVSDTKEAFQKTGAPQKRFMTFRYQANTWPHRRRMIVKCEVTSLGTNVRYVIATRRGRRADLYRWYTERGGTIEGAIEQLKNGFEGDRLSCQRFEANAFRLLLHSAAYNLMLLFREAIAVPELKDADMQTVRIKLIKVGGRVERTVRRIWIKLSSTWPFANLFHQAHASLVPQPDG